VIERLSRSAPGVNQDDIRTWGTDTRPTHRRAQRLGASEPAPTKISPLRQKAKFPSQGCVAGVSLSLLSSSATSQKAAAPPPAAAPPAATPPPPKRHL
jgi:hypothetical protein